MKEIVFFFNSKKVYEGKQVSKLIRTRIYQLYPNINFSFYFIDKDIFYISNNVTINEEVFLEKGKKINFKIDSCNKSF